MNKPKAQGTRLETFVVNTAHAAGLPAARLAEQGSNDPGDVWIGCPPSPNPNEPDHVVVWWKRLVKSDGARRVPDGVPAVVCMTPDLFLELVRAHTEGSDGQFGFVVECKAAERLNVTRVLGKAQAKLELWKVRT